MKKIAAIVLAIALVAPAMPLLSAMPARAATNCPVALKDGYGVPFGQEQWDLGDSSCPTYPTTPTGPLQPMPVGPGGATLALDGTDGTGITPPTGGVGMRGWLSGIYNYLKNGIGLPTGAATAANQTAVQGTNGSAAPAKGVLIQGWDGTNDQNISTTSGGIVNTLSAPQPTASYRAVSYGNAAYATPTDLATLTNPTGSGKTIYVTQFAILPQQTTLATDTFYFLKRSAADTGGSPTNPTAVPFDSNDAAAVGVPAIYTAAPTPGALVGTINQIMGQAVATTSAPSPYGIFSGAATSYFASPNPSTLTQPIILHPGESLAVNFNGAALPTGFTAGYLFEWTEK